MQIYFKNSKIEKLCTKRKKARKKFGDKVSKNLHRRLTQLAAFETLDSVPVHPPFRRHKLTGKLDGYFAINIDKQYRLIITNLNGEVMDLTTITIVRIEEVSKHYE